MFTDHTLHRKQNATQFFTTPKKGEEKFVWNLVITTSSNFTSDPGKTDRDNPEDRDSSDVFTPRKVEISCYGSFLSIASANAVAKDWCIRELDDGDGEQEDDFGRPSKNMWPDFWVPEGTTKAQMKTLPDETVQIDVIVGEGLKQMRYQIKIEVSDVFWEMDANFTR